MKRTTARWHTGSIQQHGNAMLFSIDNAGESKHDTCERMATLHFAAKFHRAPDSTNPPASHPSC
jgi:hypothetical protein